MYSDITAEEKTRANTASMLYRIAALRLAADLGLNFFVDNCEQHREYESFECMDRGALDASQKIVEDQDVSQMSGMERGIFEQEGPGCTAAMIYLDYVMAEEEK